MNLSRIRVASLPALALCLAACSAAGPIAYIKPYRVDVRQGNLVTQEMVAQLKPGMTRDQVRFVLGTPLVTDLYHTQRWDYVYRFQPGRGEAQQRRVSVFFNDGKLERLEGDVAPMAAAAPQPAEAAAPPPQPQAAPTAPAAPTAAPASEAAPAPAQ